LNRLTSRLSDQQPPIALHSENPDRTRFDRSSLIFFALICALFAGARLWRLAASCLWFDEIFSVHAARHDWAGLIRFTAADIIHPPLFYALLKVWIAIGGESLLWLRLLPCLIAIATIVPFWLLCRELNLKPAETNLALLLMAVSGFLIKYAQEVRMYSLLFFLSVCSIWLFIRFLKSQSARDKNLWALAAINLLLVYTHYYGWLLIGIQALILLFGRWKKLASHSLVNAGLLLAYCPWIYEVIVSREPGHGLGQNLGWIARPHISDVAEFFVLLNRPFLFNQSTADRAYDLLSVWMVFLLLGLPLILFLWRLVRSWFPKPAGSAEDPSALRARRTPSGETCLAVFAFAPVILAFILSWILPYPIWGTRHLLIGAVAFFVLAAVAILRLRKSWIKVTITLILGCWFLRAGAIALIRPAPMLTWCAWEPLVKQMPAPENNSTTTEVYAFEDLVAYHLWFAASKSNRRQFKFTVVKNVAGMSEDPAFFLPRRFDKIAIGDQTKITGEHIWLAFRAPRWDETRAPVSVVKSMGYQTGRVLSIDAQVEQAFLAEFWRSDKESQRPLSTAR
jgi:hypothetical protein